MFSLCNNFGVYFPRLPKNLLLRAFSAASAAPEAAIAPLPAPALKPDHHPLTDKHNRFHNYLRISIVEKCNLACRYCVADEEIQYSEKEKLLSAQEIGRLAEMFVKLGVTKIRLTGGEPTIRSDLDKIISSINQLRPYGLKEIALTTNGIVLAKRLDSYKAAGLDTLNISLDTLLPDKFTYISGSNGLKLVLKGIFSAIAAGYKPVKLNVVVMSGVNENEMASFVELTKDNPLDVRFLEFMPFDGNKWSRNKMVPYAAMLARVRSYYPNLQPVGNSKSDTSKSFVVPGYTGQIGFITSMSNHFCGGCNRLRITADGHLKACLFGTNEVDLRNALRTGVSDDDLTELISAAVKRKAPKHGGMDLIQKLKNRPMILIGRLATGRQVFHNRNRFNRLSSLYQSRSRQFSTYSPCLLSKYTDSIEGSSKKQLIEVEAIKMASVAGKKPTHRIARAVATVHLPPSTLEMIIAGLLPKVVSLTTLVAAIQLAGVNAAKHTPDILPLCHPIPISVVEIKVSVDQAASSVHIESVVVSDNAVTGVEMEALVAASASALTLYDLAKSAGSQDIIISDVKLVEKRGGKSDFVRPGFSSA